MLLLRLLEFAFVVLLLYFLLTQMTLPAIKGTRLFPMFDARRRAALEERRACASSAKSRGKRNPRANRGKETTMLTCAISHWSLRRSPPCS